MRRAMGYLRVSTLDQAEHGVSLEAQESRIRAWCGLNGYELAGLHVDRGLSGGRADNRPALQEALQVVRRGEALVVYSLSRLARTTHDTLQIAEMLERRGADLVSLTEKIDTTHATGKMVFRMLAVLAEFERDVIAERTRMGILQLQAKGRYIGGHRPLGWRVVADGTLSPDQAEQRLIHRACELRRTGLGLRGIARALQAEGFEPVRGARFHPEQVRRWVRPGWRACADVVPDDSRR